MFYCLVRLSEEDCFVHHYHKVELAFLKSLRQKILRCSKILSLSSLKALTHDTAPARKVDLIIRIGISTVNCGVNVDLNHV